MGEPKDVRRFIVGLKTTNADLESEVERLLAALTEIRETVSPYKTYPSLHVVRLIDAALAGVSPQAAPEANPSCEWCDHPRNVHQYHPAPEEFEGRYGGCNFNDCSCWQFEPRVPSLDAGATPR